MKIVSEIDISVKQHKKITEIRNSCFPDEQASNSYGKQLPYMRFLEYRGTEIVAFMSVDYRVLRNENEIYRVLGVVNLCVEEEHRNQGIGTAMLKKIAEYAEEKDIDFIVLLSDHDKYYTDRGFKNVTSINSWLRIHEHKNYGVAVEEVNDLYVKSVKGKSWVSGHVDWLGYIY